MNINIVYCALERYIPKAFFHSEKFAFVNHTDLNTISISWKQKHFISNPIEFSFPHKSHRMPFETTQKFRITKPASQMAALLNQYRESTNPLMTRKVGSISALAGTPIIKPQASTSRAASIDFRTCGLRTRGQLSVQLSWHNRWQPHGEPGWWGCVVWTHFPPVTKVIFSIWSKLSAVLPDIHVVV